MNRAKWLRRTLMGGVALSVSAGGASADDLNSLRAQLDALQARVAAMESSSTPSGFGSGSLLPSLPSVGAMELTRGGGELEGWDMNPRSYHSIPSGSGYTLRVNPAADMASPVKEITISGYAKADLIYDFTRAGGDSSAIGSIKIGDNAKQDRLRFHARQSRFRITANTETGVGDVRTFIEGDFFSDGNRFRLRHAYGQWQATPNAHIGFGQTGRVFASQVDGIATVDFGGQGGAAWNRPRAAQARLGYSSGPMSLTFSAEENSSKVQVAPRTTATITANHPNTDELFVLSDGDEIGANTYHITSKDGANNCPTNAVPFAGAAGSEVACVSSTVTATNAPRTGLTKNGVDEELRANVNASTEFTDATDVTDAQNIFSEGGVYVASAPTAFAGAKGHNTNRSADFAMRMTYDVPGGHNLSVAGVLVPHTITKKSGATKNTTKYGWGIDAGGNLAVGDSITITAGVLYADGAGGYANFNTAPDAVVKPDGKVRLVSTLGVRAGVSLAVTDTTSINGGWGYVSNSKSDLNSSGVNGAVTMQRLHSVHGNLMWQPSSAMRFGWEIIWGRRVNLDGKKYDNLRGQFGAWFFF
jgi:hypothetical protein